MRLGGLYRIMCTVSLVQGRNVGIQFFDCEIDSSSCFFEIMFRDGHTSKLLNLSGVPGFVTNRRIARCFLGKLQSENATTEDDRGTGE